MDDLISRQAAIDALHTWLEYMDEGVIAWAEMSEPYTED